MTKQERIAKAEEMGWKRHIEKGDPNAEEWWSPDGKFCLYEDLPTADVRTVPSSPEHDADYSSNMTGWFIFALSSREQEVSTYLGCSVYCVGKYPGRTLMPKKVFIQPSQQLDPRTGKLGYLVVIDPVHIKAVMDIMLRKYTDDEHRLAEAERRKRKDLARRGIFVL